MIVADLLRGMGGVALYAAQTGEEMRSRSKNDGGLKRSMASILGWLP